MAPPTIDSHQAPAIAGADAILAYKDLSPYRIEVYRADDGWHVEYRITMRRVAGGGPHDITDATTGVILSKKSYQ